MGNCAGANSKNKPIKPLNKHSLDNQQNTPPAGQTKPKLTLEQAMRKRQAMKGSLREESLDPPIFTIPKIQPFQRSIK